MCSSLASATIRTGATRRPFAAAALLAALGALALGLLVRFGPGIPAIDLISITSPAIALVALLAATGAIVTQDSARRRLPVVLALVAGGLLAESLATTLWRPWPDPGAAPAPLRILAYNVWAENRSPDAATRWILAQRPDAVVLIEATGQGNRIADGLRPYLPYRVSCRGARPCSTLILSRTAPRLARGLARGDADNRRALSAAVARFGGDGPGDGPPYAIVAVHLSRPLPLAGQRREVAWLAEALAGLPRQGLIMAGDFNAPLWSRTMRDLTARIGVRPIGGERPTWPAAPSGHPYPPIWPIDHALLGPGWAAARATRGPAAGSDHFPLLIELVRSDAAAPS
jgi:endonuclease/exonuclease/phosphatase (EEP) superfamily protein YafD